MIKPIPRLQPALNVLLIARLRVAFYATCFASLTLPAASFAAMPTAPAAIQLTPATKPAASPELSSDSRIRTQLAARNTVTISSELAAKISSLPLREGDSFRVGQTLVSFDCTLFQAQLNKAKASAEGARQNLQVNKRLAELNSVGTMEVTQSEAKVKENAAEVAYAQATLSKCGIFAPFSGHIAKRHAAAHQFVSPGTPLLDILDTSQLELQMIVPSKWMIWIKPGVHFSVHVEELAKNYPARVTKLGARIDPVSQTLSIYGVLEGRHPELIPGMSGWANFNAPR